MGRDARRAGTARGRVVTSLLLLLLLLSRCPAARMRSTLDLVIGSIFGSNPRSWQERLPTNPILAAPGERSPDRRIFSRIHRRSRRRHRDTPRHHTPPDLTCDRSPAPSHEHPLTAAQSYQRHVVLLRGDRIKDPPAHNTPAASSAATGVIPRGPGLVAMKICDSLLAPRTHTQRESWRVRIHFGVARRSDTVRLHALRVHTSDSPVVSE